MHFDLTNTTCLIFFLFEGCDTGWDVVDSSIFQYQTQILAHVVCLGTVLYSDRIYCFQVHKKTIDSHNSKVSCSLFLFLSATEASQCKDLAITDPIFSSLWNVMYTLR